MDSPNTPADAEVRLLAVTAPRPDTPRGLPWYVSEPEELEECRRIVEKLKPAGEPPAGQ